MANNDDNGWDTLDDELGLAPKAPVPAAKPAPVADDDFGADLIEEPAPGPALYDPGPDAVAADDDEGDDDEAEPGETTPASNEGDVTGKKKRRRRRRRKKKGGEGAPDQAGVPADVAGSSVVVVAEAAEAIDDTVEQGEAPGEIEGSDDDDEPVATSVVDAEMDREAAAPRREWQVMTWNDLVSKLYRPG